MGTVYLVTGTGSGPTSTAAYDAALSSMGLGRYNLVTVSSVLPPDGAVEVVDSVPSLGPVASLVPVVQARATATAPGAAGAALAWSVGPDGGLVYEAGRTDAPDGDPGVEAESAALTGIETGVKAREWRLPEPEVVSTTITPPPDTVGAAVVVAVLGRGDPLD